MKVMIGSSKDPDKDPDKCELAQVAIDSLEEPPQKANHKLLVTILFCSLTFGLFWQIHGMSVLFMTTPTTVAVEPLVDSPLKTLPAITFCTNIGDGTPSRRIGDLFAEFRAQDMVDNIRIASDDGSADIQMTAHLMNKTIESFSYKYYCFTINTQLKVEKQVALNKNQQLYIKLKRFGQYDSWWIYVHKAWEQPSSYGWNAVEVKKGFYVPISYTHETHHRMDSPSKPCVEYDIEKGFASHEDCSRICRITHLVNRCSVVYNGLDVQKGDPYLRQRFAKTDEEKECTTRLSSFGDSYCRGVCPQDCTKHFYKPYIIANYPNKWDHTLVQLIPTTDPELTYAEKPTYDRKVFYYYLSGSLSVWLGFVLYFLFNRLSACCKPMKN